MVKVIDEEYDAENYNKSLFLKKDQYNMRRSRSTMGRQAGGEKDAADGGCGA